jgi:hypothetical protein
MSHVNIDREIRQRWNPVVQQNAADKPGQTDDLFALNSRVTRVIQARVEVHEAAEDREVLRDRAVRRDLEAVILLFAHQPEHVVLQERIRPPDPEDIGGEVYAIQGHLVADLHLLGPIRSECSAGIDGSRWCDFALLQIIGI